MKSIINVNCDDKTFHIKIDGDNIDILTSIGEIIKKIESESGITIDTSLRYLNKYLEVENIKTGGFYNG